MKRIGMLLIILASGVWVAGQEAARVLPAQGQEALATPQDEKVDAVRPAQAAPAVGVEGFMEPARVKELLQRLWLAQYRTADLLTEVRPERWKLPDAARQAFNETLGTLQRQLAALEEWRTLFDARPDSAYLGYETCVAIGAVLPRLEAVTQSVARYENPSLGAQFSQAGNQLFDLQQAFEPYLAYLLRSQDEVMRALQTNLAGCQNELSYAMRGRSVPAVPMRNVLPEFKGGRRLTRPSGSAGRAEAAKKVEKRPEPTKGASSKPGAALVSKPGPRKP